MLTRTSLTIRLHPNDDVVIARTQLVGGTLLADENVTVAGPRPAGAQGRDPRDPRRRAGQALQPDHRLRLARHRCRRARPSQQSGDGRVRSRLRVRRRCEADALHRPAGDVHGHRARGGSQCGRVATRNYIGLLSTVNCSATVVRGIADAFRGDALAAFPNVDGVVALTHGSGCGMDSNGDGMQVLRRTLGGYARHANFAGVLVVGLGCEANQISSLLGAEKLAGGPAAAHVQHPGHRRHREDHRARR